VSSSDAGAAPGKFEWTGTDLTEPDAAELAAAQVQRDDEQRAAYELLHGQPPAPDSP
jgi:hypothetical protein